MIDKKTCKHENVSIVYNTTYCDDCHLTLYDEKKHMIRPIRCLICKKGLSNGKPSKKKLQICFTCNNKIPPEQYRCKGINLKKKQCSQWAIVETEWCFHHKPKEEIK